MEITDINIIIKIKKWESFVFNNSEYTALCDQRYSICQIHKDTYEINSPIAQLGIIKDIENVNKRQIQKIILNAIDDWSNNINSKLKLYFPSYWKKDHTGGRDYFNQ